MSLYFVLCQWLVVSYKASGGCAQKVFQSTVRDSGRMTLASSLLGPERTDLSRETDG
jgi:hypothetical protein